MNEIPVYYVPSSQKKSIPSSEEEGREMKRGTSSLLQCTKKMLGMYSKIKNDDDDADDDDEEEDDIGVWVGMANKAITMAYTQ